ncbi:phosphomannomutase [Vibrio ishigakensis]|uniref:Phosphomannomutase n=1 Tax=Vibrio ishigakensis TaxID=1481914 RepID=A0A0B8PMU5_9VIBR|nr:phosphomannomutase [Vibrio ishigakensis]
MSEKISQWLARDPDPNTRDELQHLVNTNNEKELTDRFGSRLAFGTAGLRGMIGAGPNRMNRLVIQETAMGLGNYLVEQVSDAQSRGVVIGYDGRPDSEQFARDTASVLVGLGIKVYLTHKVAATPIAAFGVLELNAAGAVVVTASIILQSTTALRCIGRMVLRLFLPTMQVLPTRLMKPQYFLYS